MESQVGANTEMDNTPDFLQSLGLYEAEGVDDDACRNQNQAYSTTNGPDKVLLFKDGMHPALLCLLKIGRVLGV